MKEEHFQWTKILLESDRERNERSFEAVRSTEMLLQKLGFTAVEVVSDYLRELWTYTHKDISGKQGEGFEQTHSLRVVLTVPAVWSPKAKDNTLQAAKNAGLPNDITLVTEPEAAALATLKDRSEVQDLEVCALYQLHYGSDI
jgi:molecular chaperone DnaK (HSP70)